MPVKAISGTLYVATNGTAPHDGLTWEHAFTSIQAAINAANPGDIIIVGSSGTGHGDGVYTKNVNVTKSLTIKSESGYEYTTVVAASSDDHVFDIRASNVTIGGKNNGFSIYGATDKFTAGICMENDFKNCKIESNCCGWDADHKNNYGIYVYFSNNNVLTGNMANFNNLGIYLQTSNNNEINNNITNSNSSCGISLQESNYNVITNNTANSNSGEGIYLYQSNNNILLFNTFNSNVLWGIELYVLCNNNLIDNNTCNENSFGMWIHASNNNKIVGNTTNLNNRGISFSASAYNLILNNNAISNNDHGFDLEDSNNNSIINNICNFNHSGINISYYSYSNIISNNIANQNYYGIYLYNSGNFNTFYLNNLSNNTSKNAYVDNDNFDEENPSVCNIWNSPTPIYYDYTSGSFHKNYLGNYYSDYTGSDDDGDGIGADSYNGLGMTDNYPLMTTSEHYSLQAWWLNNDGKMYRDDRTKAYGNVTLNAGNSQIWIASEVATKNISYSGNDTWTGQIVFTTTPANRDEFTVEIGSSTDGNDFTAGGPQATITGDGSKTIFTFETNAAAFNLTNGNYLALKLTNNSSNSYSVQTGGAWSYCSSAEIVTEPPTGENDNILSHHFSLSQNQPNPFVTSTMIRYELPERSNVSLKVYDLFGREVTTLFEGEQTAGKYEVEFNGTNLPGGIYFYQLQAGNFRTVRKLLLLK